MAFRPSCAAACLSALFPFLFHQCAVERGGGGERNRKGEKVDVDLATSLIVTGVASPLFPPFYLFPFPISPLSLPDVLAFSSPYSLLLLLMFPLPLPHSPSFPSNSGGSLPALGMFAERPPYVRTRRREGPLRHFCCGCLRRHRFLVCFLLSSREGKRGASVVVPSVMGCPPFHLPRITISIGESISPACEVLEGANAVGCVSLASVRLFFRSFVGKEGGGTRMSNGEHEEEKG